MTVLGFPVDLYLSSSVHILRLLQPGNLIDKIAQLLFLFGRRHSPKTLALNYWMHEAGRFDISCVSTILAFKSLKSLGASFGLTLRSHKIKNQKAKKPFQRNNLNVISSIFFTMPSRKPRPMHMIELPADFVPGKMHVICAKGRDAKEHHGNCLLRELVQANLKEYSACDNKLDRSFVVSRILKIFDAEGGFVRQIKGKWYNIGARNAREKIGQA